MPEERFVQVVRPLRMRLGEAKSRASSESAKCEGDDIVCSSISNVIDELLAKIESIKDFFIKLERWERDVTGGIEDIMKQLVNVLEDSFNKDEFHSQLNSQLQIINQKVSGLELHTSQVQLPSVGTDSATSTQASAHFDHIEGAQKSEGSEERLTKTEFDELEDRLSYLDPYSTCCLNSFLIFPRNSKIKKTQLIYWWIGDGGTTGIDSEMEGEICLRNLVQKRFVTPSHKSHQRAGIDSCMLHPFVYDILIQKLGPQSPLPFDPISALLCSSMEDNGYPKHIMQEKYDNVLKFTGGGGGGLRMCINLDYSVLKLKQKTFIEMRNIPVMQLGRWQISAKHHIEVENTQFLGWLSIFRNLRLLSLRGISRITSLPPTIGLLNKLKILDIRACHNLEVLPIEITMLMNLTHLNASESYLLRQMPAGLGSLSMLEILKGFVPGSWGIRDACQLRELPNLKNLRKLSINIVRETPIPYGEFRTLGSLVSLVSLTISWGLDSKNAWNESVFEIVPPPNLQKLDLRCFPVSSAPEWLRPSKLNMLERLYIRGGDLHIHGLVNTARGMIIWEQVKVLRLRYLKGLDIEVEELRNGFPSLHYLEIHECNDPRVP